MKKLFLLCSISLFALSCKHEVNDAAPDTDTCKLSASSAIKNITYDNSGRVATLTTEGYDGTMTVMFLSMFSYDAAGKLTKTVYTVDGKPNSEDTYTYTDGRITRVNFNGPNSPTGINNLSYDASGHLIRYTVEVGGQVQYAQTYAYNADGVIIEQAVVSSQGNVLDRAVIKPVGNVKSPEQLLVKNGVPYLVPTGTPLSVAEGGVGTVTEFYSADPTGKLTLAGSQKVSAVKTNAQGYLTEYTVTDGDGKNPTTLIYTLTDCP